MSLNSMRTLGALTLGPKLIGARRRRVCKRFAAVGERLGRTGVLRALRKTHVELFLVCADLKIYRTVLGLDALGSGAVSPRSCCTVSISSAVPVSTIASCSLSMMRLALEASSCKMAISMWSGSILSRMGKTADHAPWRRGKIVHTVFVYREKFQRLLLFQQTD